MDIDDPDQLAALPSERLEAEVQAVAAHLAAGTCTFLLLVAEFDRRELFRSWECLSTAHWLGWKCGIGLHAAREQVRVGRRLVDLPAVRTAFGQGRLSYSKVRALTRVARPDTEAALVQLALHGTAAQVEQACGRLRRLADPAAEDDRLADAERLGRQRGHLSWVRDTDGGVSGRFRLGPEAAEVLERALAIAADELVGGDGAPSTDQRRATALEAIASEWLADPSTGAGAEPELVVHVRVPLPLDRAPAGSVPSGPGDAGDPARRHVDPAGIPSLAPAVDLGHWPVRTAGGRSLSLGALERLACQAGVRWVADLPDGTVADLGRHRRLPSRAQRRALRARDRHCRFPGCHETRRLRPHHIVWWSRGGPTDLANLVLLCHRHHHAVHDREWSCTGTATDLRWARPDGQPVSGLPPVSSGALIELVADHHRHGRDVAVGAPGGHWYGDSIDWDCFFAAFAPPLVAPSAAPSSPGPSSPGRPSWDPSSWDPSACGCDDAAGWESPDDG